MEVNNLKSPLTWLNNDNSKSLLASECQCEGARAYVRVGGCIGAIVHAFVPTWPLSCVCECEHWCARACVLEYDCLCSGPVCGSAHARPLFACARIPICFLCKKNQQESLVLFFVKCFWNSTSMLLFPLSKLFYKRMQKSFKNKNVFYTSRNDFIKTWRYYFT